MTADDIAGIAIAYATGAFAAGFVFVMRADSLSRYEDRERQQAARRRLPAQIAAWPVTLPVVVAIYAARAVGGGAVILVRRRRGRRAAVVAGVPRSPRSPVPRPLRPRRGRGRLPHEGPMTNENRCATCAHWDGPPTASYPDTEPRALCRMLSDDAHRMVSAVGACPDGNIGATVYTSEDFGCALWEAKP